MSNQNIIIVHDIVEENGKTIKENNMEKTHKFPIGALVEAEVNIKGQNPREIPKEEWDTIPEGGTGWEADGILKGRFYVISHNRDCDGTPLYTISMTHPEEYEEHPPIHLLFGDVDQFVHDIRFGTDKHPAERDYMLFNREMSRSDFFKMFSGMPEESLTLITEKPSGKPYEEAHKERMEKLNRERDERLKELEQENENEG